MLQGTYQVASIYSPLFPPEPEKQPPGECNMKAGLMACLSRSLDGKAEGEVDSLPTELEQGTQIFQTALKILTCMSNDPISVLFLGTANVIPGGSGARLGAKLHLAEGRSSPLHYSWTCNLDSKGTGQKRGGSLPRPAELPPLLPLLLAGLLKRRRLQY